jgi:transcriptional regulator with XRE-family HTH domain
LHLFLCLWRKISPKFYLTRNKEVNVVNKTIEDGLRPYQIGPKLRTLRLKKSMGLVELGKHTGLSPALLSKLERDKLFPTLPTLLRIAMVFSVGLDYFFTDERKRHILSVVRKDERIRLPERPGTQEVAYFFESLDYKCNERRTNSYLADFEAIEPEKLKPHQHPGSEFLHVTKGKLGLKVGLDDFELEAGDSIYFDASVPHTYRRVGKPPCQALIVTAG